jgi:hypothetical protein
MAFLSKEATKKAEKQKNLNRTERCSDSNEKLRVSDQLYITINLKCFVLLSYSRIPAVHKWRLNNT